MTRFTGACLVAVLVAAAGCTACPDPFDYSGPVPNGSAPHNDFCARSNGILPLNAAPAPWPPVVNEDRERRVAEPIAEADEATLRDGVTTASATQPTGR